MNNKFFWIGYVLGIFLAVGSISLGVSKFSQVTLTGSDIFFNKMVLSDLNGKVINVTDFGNKPLVVNYWATWCVSCVEEFPDFEKVKQQFGDRVNFVMVSDETIEKISTFNQKNPYSFIFVKCIRPLTEYGLNFRPATYIYNSKGNLTSKTSGALTAKELKADIDKSF